jgi:hypothetical protein
MKPEKERFRRLVRHFAYRFVDHDLVASDGDIHQTLVNVLAVLATLSFVQAVLLILKYFFRFDHTLPAIRQLQLWVDQEFLISLVIAAVGFFTVLGWDALFPDRRDALALGALGVRPGTFLGARLCAIAMFLGLVVSATISFLVISFPFQITGQNAPFRAIAHAFAVNLTVLAGAGCFAFLSFFAVRGVLVLTLGYSLQQRLSAWIQLVAMVALLLGLFLLPNPAIVRQGPAWLGAWLPSYWFLSLEQRLLGAPQPLPWDFSSRALNGLAVSAAVAFGCFAAGYKSALRKAAEEGEISPRERRPITGMLLAPVGRFFLSGPRQRAAFLFTARTMFRSRKHRLLLAVYCAVGLAYVGGGLSRAIERASNWEIGAPSPALTSIPLDLAFALLLGARVLFSTPVELNSNWIFRMNQNGSPDEYVSGVRKFLLLLAGVPLALAPLPAYAAMWGPGAAIRHSIFFLLVVAWLVELLLRDFHKIPFTCSAFPGKANLKIRIPAYFVLFTVVSYLLALLDTYLAGHPGAFTVFTGACALGYAALRWKRARDGGGWSFQWEEKSDWFARMDLAQ